MFKHRSIILAAAVVFAAPAAGAFQLPSDVTLEVGGRFEYGTVVEKESPMFPWNYSSGSLNDRTRLMLDLRAGKPRYGEIYVKSAAEWAAPRTASGDVNFDLKQGDYLWSCARPDSGYGVRIFANERRYFTGEMSEALLDDDIVVRPKDLFDTQTYGGRFDAAWKGKYRCSAIGSVLGRRWNDARKFYYLRTGFLGRFIQASAAYLFDSQAPESLDNHAVVKGELTGFYKKLCIVASYEQSGFDDRAVFLPSGDVDWNGFVGNNFSSIMPEAGAVFAELRLVDLPFRELCDVTFVHRYRALGNNFVNDLGTLRRAEVGSSSGLYFAAKDVAVDGRLEYSKSSRSRFGREKRERMEAGFRGLLKNGSEVVLRGALAKNYDRLSYETKENFIHAAVKRSGHKIESGVHVMVKDIDDGEFARRFAVETRLNWTTEISVYGRLLIHDEETSNDAVYWRLELRPTDHVFATLAYGREFIGDGPFVLEDPDIGRTGDADAVYAITVRGDF